MDTIIFIIVSRLPSDTYQKQNIAKVEQQALNEKGLKPNDKG